MALRRAAKIVSVGMGATLLGTLALRVYVDRDRRRMRQSETHSDSSSLKQYCVFRGMEFLGRRFAVSLETEAAHAKAVQEDLAFTLLRNQQKTVFGQEHKFVLLTDRASIRTHVPLATPEDFAPYVQRMVQGEGNVLVPATTEVKMIGETSGTSGARRLIPTTTDQARAFFLYGISLVFDSLFRWVPSALSLQRTLKLMYRPSFRVTPQGLRIGPNSSNPEDSADTIELYSTPAAAFALEDEQDLLYLHALFALRDRNLGLIEANFGSSILHLFALLDDPTARERLLRDLEDGTVGPHLNLPPHVRSSLQSGLRPLRARAEEVRTALAAHDARGKRVAGPPGVRAAGAADSAWASSGSLCQDLWPHLNAIVSVGTGAFQLSQRQLRERYLPPARDLPWYSPLYAATEGLLGVNIAPFDDGVPPPADKTEFFVHAIRDAVRATAARLHATESAGGSTANATVTTTPTTRAKDTEAWVEAEVARLTRELLDPKTLLPSENAFLLHPRVALFEFIPEEAMESENPPTCFLEEAEPGRNYELVVTTLSGLWRCRLGDVVRVVGRHKGACPVVQVLYRRGQCLDVRGEKSSEPVLTQAVQRAAADQTPAVGVADFAFVEPALVPRGGGEARYTLFLEWEAAKGVRPPAKEAMAAALDRHLRTQNATYDLFRTKRRLLEPEVRVVPPGTFRRARKLAADGNPNQTKTPRVLRHEAAIQALSE